MVNFQNIENVLCLISIMYFIEIEGRIPGKLPVISTLASPNGREGEGSVRVWFPSKDSAISNQTMPPVCTNDLLPSVDRRFSLDQVRFGSFRAGKNSTTFLSAGKLALKGHNLKSAISVDVSLGDLETVKRMSTGIHGSGGGLWLRTDNNRLRTRAKSADNARDLGSWNDSSPEEDIAASDGHLALCRYTPLPAIGCLTKEETVAAQQDDRWDQEVELPEISRPDVDRELRSNSSALWNCSTENTLEKAKLPPLRPIVRSRTFTIISSALSNDNDNRNDDDKSNEEEVDELSNWEDDRTDSSDTQMSEDDGIEEDQDETLEDKVSDDDDGTRDEIEKGRERDTLMCLAIRLPNGEELQKYFDFEDTLENVLNFALHRFNETALTEVEELPRYQLATDEEMPRVFTDFAKSLCELEIPNRARFYLQPLEVETTCS